MLLLLAIDSVLLTIMSLNLLLTSGMIMVNNASVYKTLFIGKSRNK